MYTDDNYTNNNNMKEPNKMAKFVKFVPYILVVGVIIAVGMLVFPNVFFKSGDSKGEGNSKTVTPAPTVTPKPTPALSKYKIFDTTSNKRPYAISINNTNVAVKVQEGLNKAYLVYEIPTEFHTSRLLAFFKDVNDLTVGTIRSCRHNFKDYANESDAILVCFGWSHYARDEFYRDAKTGGFEYLNGNEKHWSSAFWRSNPEKLAREHTAYTSLGELIDFTTKNKYRLTSNDSQLLNYSAEEVDLGSVNGSKTAKNVTVRYGGTTTKFTYDANSKMYVKAVNGKTYKDHKTKEKITTKNIIIVKIPYKVMPDKYYWDLKNTGSGKGYYITNGKYVPITWKKDSRDAKSKYYYSDGTEIRVNDGRTYIEVNTTSYKVSIS